MIRNYLKIAWRNLLRSPGLSFITIAGFSTGLAFVLLISIFIKSELSYDQFHKNKQNIYRITGEGTDDHGNVFKTGNTRATIGPLFTPPITTVKKYCRVDGSLLLVKENNDAISENVIMVDNSFFSMFSFPLLSGNAGTVLHAPDETVVTDETAMKIFGTTDVMGKIINIEIKGNFIPFKITGIAKKTPYNSTIYFDVIIPFNNAVSPKTTEDLKSSFVNTFITTDGNANVPAIEVGLTDGYNKYNKDNQQKSQLLNYKYRLQPVTGMHLSEDFNLNNGLRNGSSKKYTYILGSIALFILLIACINFINIILARSMQRAREIGVRKVAGSTKGQLAFQFLTESLVITFFSILPSIVIITFLLPYFSGFVNMDIHPFAILDAPMIALSLGLVTLTGILAGSYPALVLSSYKPVQALSGKIKFSGKNLLSRGLIIFQFIMVVLLIISTLCMKDQFLFLSNKNLGYQTDDIAIVRLPHDSYKKVLPVLSDDLNNINGVMQTTITNWGWNRTKFNVDGVNTDWTYYQLVDDHFISFFRIKLLQGRNFYASPNADRSSCMINAAFARSMGWKNAIGHQIKYNDKLYTVTGVTADYNNASLKEEIQPIVLLKRDSSDFGQIYIHYAPSSFVQVKTAVHSAFKKIDPWHNEETMEMKDFNAEKYAGEKSWVTIVNFSAIVCIILSCLGLFGLSSLNIGKRVKEIGIRKVLGAGIGNIVLLMAKDFLKLVIIAAVIAFPIGWWAMNKWLQAFAYRVSLHWWLFVLAAFIALSIALFTISFQAIKAACANPVKSLKSE
jgi:putative ABC transport system permease protein